MLILSRGVKERIVINNNIIIEVVEIDGNRVRLGIEAPNDVPLFRKEILDEAGGPLPSRAKGKSRSGKIPDANS